MEHLEILPGGTKVFTSAGHRFTTDSLLLAEFSAPRREWSACDLGSGCGILLLSLLDKGLSGRAVAIEKDSAATKLLQRSAHCNGFTQVEAVTADMRDYSTPYPFDMVISNPPYFAGGPVSPDKTRADARHQHSCSIQEVCAAASRLLKTRGRFYVCFPAEGLSGLFFALAQSRLQPKKMQLVRKSPAGKPRLVLLEARKDAGEGLIILPDRLVAPGAAIQY